MFIAQGMYRFSTPSPTKAYALMQLFTYSIFRKDDSWIVTLQTDGHKPFTYYYSVEFTATEAIEDAIKSHYKSFNIKLYQEI